MSFKNTSSIKSGLNSYAWNFGDNSSSANTSPSHTYGADGAYSVLLTATSNQGCVDSSRKSVTVFALPNPAFTVNNECLTDTFNFNNTSTGAASYAWNFGDSKTSTVSNPQHQYSVAGFYTAKLIATSANNCVDSFSRKIQAFEMPTAGFTQTNVCMNDTMFFTDNSSVADKYTYYFGGRKMANTANAKHLYGNSGKYSVLQIVETSNGCRDSLRKTVEVYALPVADFSAPTVCYTDSTQFANNSNNYVSSKWSFGNGASSILNNPTLLYGKAKNYSVELIAESSKGCLDTVTKTVTVNALPQVAFTMNDTCFGKANTFTNNTSGASSYDWSYGDGNSSTAQTPSHTYSKDGSFDVKLIATTSLGCQDSASNQITIHPLPKVSFTQSNVCDGVSMYFKNGSSISKGTNTYLWLFGNRQTSANTSPWHLYANTGKYDVKLIATSDRGCKDSISKQVEVYAQPEAAFSHTDVCNGFDMHFTNETKLAHNVNWSFGDGLLSTDQNPTHLFVKDGRFNVQLKTSTAYCSDSISKTVSVYKKPIAGFTLDSTCLGGPINFTNTSFYGEINTHDWTFGDGSGSALINPKKVYKEHGSYNVQLIVTTDNNCKDTANATAVVHPNPKAKFNTTNVCAYDSTEFNNNSSIASGNIAKYKWSFGNGLFSSQASPSHFYGKSGSYTVVLTAISDFGCTNFTDTLIQVFEVPNADFTSTIVCEENYTTFTDQSIGNIKSYSWSFEDGNTSIDKNPRNLYSLFGNYNVQLIVESQNGCLDTVLKNTSVLDKPEAIFSAQPVCYLQITEFTNTSVAAIESFWNFGDEEGFSGLDNPNYNYLNPGVYDVELQVVSAQGCRDTIINQVEVYELPIANFSVINHCFRDELFPTDKSIGNVSNWTWQMGDGETLTGSAPSHIYSIDGEYTINLNVEDANGCIDSVKRKVIVHPLPVMNISADTIVSKGYEVPLLATGGTYYNWGPNFGLNKYDIANPVATVTEDVTYTVSITTEYGCESDTFVTLRALDDYTVEPSNIITPDGNGKNDYWIVEKANYYDDIEVIVFDRWGRIVYQAKPYKNNWDGTVNGKPLPDGAYYYIIKVPTERESYKGSITIFR
jgi:gliding motility-associated-like protein